MTTPASAYPLPIEDLLPQARKLADTIGTIPSRNHLMRALKVGAPKATALRDALTNPQDMAYAAPPATVADTPVSPTPALPASPEPEPLSALPALPDMTDPPNLVLPTGPPSLLADTTAGAAPSATDSGPQIAVDGHPATLAATPSAAAATHRVRSWPVFLIALPAFVAIWSGWVGLGTLTGFGIVHPLPGIWDDFSLNTAVTLPIGVEVYAAYALRAWLAGTAVPRKARRFAKWSAICSLLVGSAGQVAYHLMESAGMTAAPWWITTAVSCLPVAVLGMGAALAHLLNSRDEAEGEQA